MKKLCFRHKFRDEDRRARYDIYTARFIIEDFCYKCGKKFETETTFVEFMRLASRKERDEGKRID